MRHAALTSALQLFDKDSLSKPSPNQHCSSLLTHLLASVGNVLLCVRACVCLWGGVGGFMTIKIELHAELQDSSPPAHTPLSNYNALQQGAC